MKGRLGERALDQGSACEALVGQRHRVSEAVAQAQRTLVGQRMAAHHHRAERMRDACQHAGVAVLWCLVGEYEIDRIAHEGSEHVAGHADANFESHAGMVQLELRDGAR